MFRRILNTITITEFIKQIQEQDINVDVYHFRVYLDDKTGNNIEEPNIHIPGEFVLRKDLSDKMVDYYLLKPEYYDEVEKSFSSNIALDDTNMYGYFLNIWKHEPQKFEKLILEDNHL